MTTASTSTTNGQTRHQTQTPKLQKFPYPMKILRQSLEEIEELSQPTYTAEKNEQAIAIVYKLIFPDIPERPPQDTRTTLESATPRFLTQLRNSNFKQASRELERGRVAPLQPPIISQLLRLYPLSANILDLHIPDINSSRHLEISSNDYMDQLDRMRISAPGPSRITASHIKNLCRKSEKIRDAFVTVANIILLGLEEANDPRLVRLTNARGIPLVKKDKPGLTVDEMEIRPIGINEAFMNVIVKWGLSKVQDKISKKLTQHDFGYNRPGSVEGIIHSLRGLYNYSTKQQQQFALIQTDFSNAFNSIARQAIFEAVEETCPELLPLVRFRYQAMNIAYKDHVSTVDIPSSSGVSQGCPLSPALFQLVMSKVLRKARSQGRQGLIFSYLDDNSIVFKSMEEAVTAFETIAESARQVGLNLNITKCRIFWFKGSNTEEKDEEAFTRLRHLKISYDGAKVLGAFVGSPEYIKHHLEKTFDKIRDRINQVRDIFEYTNQTEYRIIHPESIAQKQLKYIKFSLSSLSTFSLRTATPELTSTFAVRTDEAVASCIVAILKSADPKLIPLEETSSFHQNFTRKRHAISYERIFIREGGIGINSANWNAIPAFLGSMALIAPILQQTTTSYIDKEAPASTITDHSTYELMLECANQDNPEENNDIFPILKPHLARKGIQKKLSKIRKRQRTKHIHATLLQDAKTTKTVQSRGRLQNYVSARNYNSGQWMEASTKLECNTIDDQLVKDDLLKRIGLSPDVPKTCKQCNTAVNNSSEFHGVSCCHVQGGNRKAGNILEKVIFEGVNKLEPGATRIPKLSDMPFFTIKDTSKTSKKYGDIRSFHKGIDTIIDVTMTSKLLKPIVACSRLAEVPARAERRKLLEYTENLSFPKQQVIPFAVDSMGAWGPQMETYLHEANESYKQQMNLKYNREWRFIKEQISIAVVKANGVYMKRLREGINIKETDKENEQKIEETALETETVENDDQESDRNVMDNTTNPATDSTSRAEREMYEYEYNERSVFGSYNNRGK